MPKKRPENGYPKIIKAAKTLFVKNGFNGTSLRDIAKKATVPVSLIYHYFDSKAHLWKEVKLTYLKESGWEEKDIFPQHEDFESFIRGFVQQRIHFLAKHPDMLRLFDWQRLEDKKSQLFGIGNTKNTSPRKNLIDCIAHFRQKGQIYDNLSDDEIFSMIFGLVFGPFVRTGLSCFKTQQTRQKYIDTIGDMLVNTIVQK
ncbi:TetR/AcrR family transcriptional regulator [Facilibium subflavum]|uniref:TetR/AcrR family transcriptional regulator n=1 Tax=Facilibium subflavum TaxID=2219058 RepID=UPI000E65A3F6|nr:TetR/AcrR family transcriptional regulator [Facilibium subflavum]